MNRIYEGVRTDSPDEASIRITVDGGPLNMRNDIRNHSPDGGNWGYAGSGPAQLSLAILADATGDDELAQGLYQRFKREFIAGIDRDVFLITQAEVRCWVAAILVAEPPDDTPSPDAGA